MRSPVSEAEGGDGTGLSEHSRRLPTLPRPAGAKSDETTQQARERG